MYRSGVRCYRDGCMPPTMLPPQRSSERWGHVPALDGIRGLAVLGVVAHHLGHLRGGYLGVDAFFVLSNLGFGRCALGPPDALGLTRVESDHPPVVGVSRV